MPRISRCWPVKLAITTEKIDAWDGCVSTMTEQHLEQETLAWLWDVGCTHLYSPDIVHDGPTPARAHHPQVQLAGVIQRHQNRAIETAQVMEELVLQQAQVMGESWATEPDPAADVVP